MSLAHVRQALTEDSRSSGQLLLTAVVCCSDVLQSSLQKCAEGYTCRRLACAIGVFLEGMGWGLSLVHPSPQLLCGAGSTGQQVRPRGSLKQFSKPRPDLGSPRTWGPLTHNNATLTSAHRQGLGIALQPDGVFLIHLLELQLQPGVLSLSLAELALAGGQHLGMEAALNLCSVRWSSKLVGPPSPRP